MSAAVRTGRSCGHPLGRRGEDAIGEAKDALHPVGVVAVVGDQDQAAAAVGGGVQGGDDEVAGLGGEGAGGVVGQQARRLLLGQVRDADLVRCGHDLGTALAARQPPLAVDQGHRHVLRRGEVLEQEEALEHEAELGAAQGGGPALGQAGDVPAAQQVLPTVGPVEQADQAEQGALAGARAAEDRDALTTVDGQVHSGQNRTRLLLALECLGHRGEPDEGRHRQGGHRQGRHHCPGVVPGGPSPSDLPGGRFGPGTATVSPPVRPDLISTTLPSLRPSTTSRVSRVLSGRTMSTLPLPWLPATASTGRTSALATFSVTTSRAAAAPLISFTSAGAVHTRRRPVGSDAWLPPLRPGADGPPPGGGPGSLPGGGVGCVATGGSGMVPGGRAAIVPSTVQPNGPGPFLICAWTDPAESEIRYAWAPSMSATMP